MLGSLTAEFFCFLAEIIKTVVPNSPHTLDSPEEIFKCQCPAPAPGILIWLPGVGAKDQHFLNFLE